ncbi:DMT superfamily transport protein [Natronomonas moolapensis 8.8.11]|uniref:DMT superfamily transport protein n=1 Tax=Natronomonas moolapensis (strain DSM 18674 / CECT 7526 / JCM 14361 / 8.8.11) TaxID=268739 RepID=M1XL41_NATM8|nr:EamA family transporter [Natronomonas moolapensis]CCQ37032.1 DMT superfamily transport protein [Natronomonas moolapensis 8.8.11]
MSRLRVPALLVGLSLLWGVSFPAISIGLGYLPPLLFAAFRYDVAAILLLGYVGVTTDDRGWVPTGRNNVAAIAAGGVFLVAGNGLLFVGQQTVPSGIAAILQALVPIVTALWALVLLDERLSAVGTLGVVVGFVGIGLIVRPDPGNLTGSDTLGRLLVVGQVVSVSLGGVLIQRARPSMERVAMTGWAMLVGGVVLHVFSFAGGESVPTALVDPIAIGAVVYLGVFSTAIAFVIYFTVLSERGAFEVSLVTYLVPIVATIAGVFLLGESVGPLSVLGFVIVFVGFALLKRHAIADVIAAAG